MSRPLCLYDSDLTKKTLVVVQKLDLLFCTGARIGEMNRSGAK